MWDFATTCLILLILLVLGCAILVLYVLEKAL